MSLKWKLGLTVFVILFGLLGQIQASPTRPSMQEEMDSTMAYTAFVSKDGKTIDVYLGDEIGPAIAYSQLEFILSKATSDQTFIFHIAGYGGSTDAGTQLMWYIQNTKANTVMRVEAPSYSMHAMLVCSGKHIEALPNTYLMFHDYSIGYEGKANEALKMIEASNHQLKKVMQDTCLKRKLLTKNEVEAIMTNGTDIYVHDDEINKRVSH